MRGENDHLKFSRWHSDPSDATATTLSDDTGFLYILEYSNTYTFVTGYKWPYWIEVTTSTNVHSRYKLPCRAKISIQIHTALSLGVQFARIQ